MSAQNRRRRRTSPFVASHETPKPIVRVAIEAGKRTLKRRRNHAVRTLTPKLPALAASAFAAGPASAKISAKIETASPPTIAINMTITVRRT